MGTLVSVSLRLPDGFSPGSFACDSAICLGLCTSAIEIIPNLLQIFPGLTFLGGIAEQVSRMECRHDFDAFVILKYPAQPGDAFTSVEQVLHRRVSKNHDHFGSRGSNFSQQKRLAHHNFVGKGSAISRWPAAINIPD